MVAYLNEPKWLTRNLKLDTQQIKKHRINSLSVVVQSGVKWTQGRKRLHCCGSSSDLNFGKPFVEVLDDAQLIEKTMEVTMNFTVEQDSTASVSNTTTSSQGSLSSHPLALGGAPTIILFVYIGTIGIPTELGPGAFLNPPPIRQVKVPVIAPCFALSSVGYESKL